jgi:hypothetical protein
LGRSLKLPFYLTGLAKVALGFGEIRRGLEGAAGVVQGVIQRIS